MSKGGGAYAYKKSKIYTYKGGKMAGKRELLFKLWKHSFLKPVLHTHTHTLNFSCFFKNHAK